MRFACFGFVPDTGRGIGDQFTKLVCPNASPLCQSVPSDWSSFLSLASASPHADCAEGILPNGTFDRHTLNRQQWRISWSLGSKDGLMTVILGFYSSNQNPTSVSEHNRHLVTSPITLEAQPTPQLSSTSCTTLNSFPLATSGLPVVANPAQTANHVLYNLPSPIKNNSSPRRMFSKNPHVKYPPPWFAILSSSTPELTLKRCSPSSTGYRVRCPLSEEPA